MLSLLVILGPELLVLTIVYVCSVLGIAAVLYLVDFVSGHTAGKRAKRRGGI